MAKRRVWNVGIKELGTLKVKKKKVHERRNKEGVQGKNGDQ